MTQSTDFWSARRARVAEEEEALREVESEKAQAQLNEAQEEKSDEEILLEHNLPSGRYLDKSRASLTASRVEGNPEALPKCVNLVVAVDCLWTGVATSR